MTKQPFYRVNLMKMVLLLLGEGDTVKGIEVFNDMVHEMESYADVARYIRRRYYLDVNRHHVRYWVRIMTMTDEGCEDDG